MQANKPLTERLVFAVVSLASVAFTALDIVWRAI